MNDVLGKLNQLQVKGDLFKDVKYYVTGNLEPEVCDALLCYFFKFSDKMESVYTKFEDILGEKKYYI